MANIIDPFKPKNSGIVDPYKPSPTLKRPDADPAAESEGRSFGQMAKDTVVGVGQGLVNLVGGVASLAEAGNPVNAAKAGLNRLGIDTLGTATNYAADATNKTSEYLTSKLSPTLQRKKQELADTDGFLASAKKIVTDPALAGQFVAEQVPNLATLGYGTAARAAGAANAARTATLSRGLGAEAAADAAKAAGKKAGERFITGASTAMESGSANTQAIGEAMAQPDEVWAQSPEYQALVSGGMDPQDAKRTLAQQAGAVAAGVTAPLAFLGAKVSAPFETELFTRQLPGGVSSLLSRQGATRVAGATAKETAEEAVQEGGNQFGVNVGARTSYDPARDLMEGVPEAAGTGAALGGLLGGGMGAANVATGRPEATLQRPEPTTQPAEADPSSLRALPAPVYPVTPAGSVITSQDTPRDPMAPMSRPGMGLTPDVRAAQTQHPGFTAPVRYPDAAPGSLSDAANTMGAPMAGNGQPVIEGEATRVEAPQAPADGSWSREQITNYLRTQLELGTVSLPPASLLAETFKIKPREASELRREVMAAAKAAKQQGNANGTTAGRSTATGDLDDPRAAVVSGGFEGANAAAAEPAPGSLSDAANATVDSLAPATSPEEARAVKQQQDLDYIIQQGRNGRVPPVSQIVKYGYDPDTARALRKQALDALTIRKPTDQEADRGQANAAAPSDQVEAGGDLFAGLAGTGDAGGAPQDAIDVGAAVVEQVSGGDSGAPEGAAASVAGDAAGAQAEGLTYDESPDALDDDIMPPSGNPFTIRDAADREAARRENARVFEVEGGFVVREPSRSTGTSPQAAPASPNELEQAQSQGPAAAPTEGGSVDPVLADAQASPQGSDPVQAIAAVPASEPVDVDRSSAQDTPAGSAVQVAANEAATSPTNGRPEPTEAQKEAGNYKKGHATINGLAVSIENPAGTSRRPEWPPLTNHYGYFKGTVGKDKDHVDVFLTDRAEDTSLPVFIVDQVDPKTGRFDEHKVIMGVANAGEARATYAANYAKDWQGLRAVTQMSQDEFKAWVSDPDKTKQPAAKAKVGLTYSESRKAETEAGAAKQAALSEKAKVSTLPGRQANGTPAAEIRVVKDGDDWRYSASYFTGNQGGGGPFSSERFASEAEADAAARAEILRGVASATEPADRAQVERIRKWLSEQGGSTPTTATKPTAGDEAAAPAESGQQTKLRNFGWDAVKLSEHSLEDLERLRKDVEARHANPKDSQGHPLENGQPTIYLYDQAGRRKLDALGRAVTFKLNTARESANANAAEQATDQPTATTERQQAGLARIVRRADGVAYLRRAAGLTVAQAQAAFDAVDRKHLKEGTRYGDDLVAAAKTAKANPPAKAEKSKAQDVPPPAPAAAGPDTLDGQLDLMKRLADGAVSLDEYRAGFAALRENRTAILAELGELTIDKLLPLNGMNARRSDGKDRLVRGAYDDLVTDYNLGGSFTWTMGERIEDVIATKVAAATEQTLRDYAERIAASRAERKARVEAAEAGLQDPKTIEDFTRIARSLGGEAKLTPEQRETFDRLRAEARREKREADAKRNAEIRRVDTGATGMSLVETKHTQKGHDLFVVRMDERVERDVYDRLNIASKRLGGYYSSFKGNGAVPGFQFTTREAAEQFMAVRDGNVDASAQQEARAAAKTEDRAESLAAKAEKLRDKANEKLGRERKDNTARRARMAASAEADARRELAIAETMGKIAKAIEAGTAGLLNFVRHRTQVELFDTLLHNAHDAHMRELGVNWEKAKEEPVTKAAVVGTTLPTYHLSRGDAIRVARRLMDARGGKQLGTELAKQVDYGDEYGQAVQANPYKFAVAKSKADGSEQSLAFFAKKGEAEAALKRSPNPRQFVVVKLPGMKAAAQQWAVALAPDLAIERKLWAPDYDKKVYIPPNIAEKIIDVLGITGNSYGEVVPYWWKTNQERRSQLAKLGIETGFELREALRRYLDLRQAPTGEDRVRKLERALVGDKSVGVDFFPTPPAVIQRLIEQADIQPGMHVLEPSAGKGDIAQAMREAADDVTVDTVEMSHALREILEAKGFDAIAHDFLAHSGEPVYDRIVMNPPFLNDNGAAHVRHAYSLLKPGGRLVAVMGAGSRGKAEFEQWLDDVGGLSESLPEGSFKSSFRPTGVATKVVVIEKSEAEQPKLSRPDSRTNGGGLTAAQTRAAIAPILKQWRGDMPKVEVLASAEGLPAAHQEAEGYYDDETGTVFLIAPNLRGGRDQTLGRTVDAAERARRVLVHEAIGHYGIEAITGPELWGQVGDTIRKMRDSGKHDALFAEIGRRYVGANDAIFIREAVAVMAEKGIRNSVVDRVIAALRRFLRQTLGINLEFNERELRAHIAAAARYVRSGSRPRVASALPTADAFASRVDLNPAKEVRITEIQGGKFGPVSTGQERAHARHRAREWLEGMRERGATITNEDSGISIGFSRSGNRELIAWTARPERIELLAALPAVTRHAVLAGFKTEDIPRSLPRRWAKFYAPVEIGGELRIARLVARDDGAGSFVYDLQASGVLETQTPAGAGVRGGGTPAPKAGPFRVMTVAQIKEAVATVDLPGWTFSRALPTELASEVATIAGLTAAERRNPATVGFAEAMYRAMGTDSPFFQAWFGDSQVADEDGLPLVVHHGTASDFDAFDDSRSGGSTGHMTTRLGHFFAQARDKAQRYAEKASDGVPADERVLDVYLSIANPHRMTVDQLMAIESPDEATALRKRLEREGHDGIQLTDIGQWIAFKAEQIKAVDNRGTFAADDARMLFSKPDADPASSEFREWFTGSKMVDAQDEPQVLYHGTTVEFSQFSREFVGEATGDADWGDGFYFTDSRKAAEGYARGPTGKVMEVYLSIKNPATNEVMLSDEVQQAIDDEDGMGFSSVEDVLEGMGHDGIVFTHKNGEKEVVVFRPEQIRLASTRGLFSRPDPQATIDAVDAAAAGMPEGFVEKVRNAFRSLKPENLRENTRPVWLGALTLRHLAELGSDLKLPHVTRYADRVQKMSTDRNIMQEEAAVVGDKWEAFQRKDRNGADATANLMHDTTIAGVDPSQDYRPLLTGVTKRGDNELVTEESIRRRLAMVEKDRAEASGEKAIERLEAEAARWKSLLAREQERRRQYPVLVQRWLALPEDGRALYVDARDAYTKQSERLEEALIERIEATAADERTRQSFIADIRLQFESARLEGPYFPLARFGNFWISAEKDGEPTFYLYETVQEWREAQRQLPKQGYVVKAAGRKIEEARNVAGASTGFMADLEKVLESAGLDDKTRDEVWQLYLRTLPELSMRKHYIHRKKTAGYSNDALRAFAGNMFHGSFQIARVRHTHALEADLLSLKKVTASLAESDPERAAKAAALTSEVGQRHEWVMNPKDSAAVSKLTSLGFAWYLGTTPAAALVNLTQTAIVTFPVLAAKFGVTRAANALSNGMGRALRNVDGNLTRGLTAEEQAAFKVWHDSGAIDRTQAHNLAGLSETDTRAFNPAARKAMTVISYLFHKAEVVNREATALAAFRLARADGMNFADAAKYAGDVIVESHFDYSNANRARWMQSNAAKVLLLFRQYSLNVTWFLWRNLYLGLKGESKEVRTEARKKLAGVLGMTSVFSGVLGLPLMSVGFGLANAAADAFGDDDDEPFDAEVEFRNFLADMLGPDLARGLTGGPIEALTGAEISSRVSLNNLWLRDPDRELEGQAMADYLLEQAAGPIFGGMLVNSLRGMKMVGEGHTWRGFEAMTPKAVKDGMKAVRYATQGANTLRGDPIIEDLNLGQVLLQLAGFSPASLNERYDANSAAKNFEQSLLDRRQRLLDAYAMAWRNEDTDALASVRDKIIAWNGKQPELGITMATIRKSLASRMRYSARAEGGVVLDQRVAEKARAQARFGE